MRIAGLLVVLVAGVTQSHPLLAQQELASVDLPVSAQYQGQSRAGNLDRPISISVSKVTLEQFVARITAATGVAFDYPAGLFPAGKTVSVSVTEMSARDVLAKALRPHGVVLGAESPGHAALAKAQASAVQDGVITGKVIHARTKQPIVSATVTVGSIKASTAADGTFRIVLSPGDAVMTIRAVGFIRESKNLVVLSGETVTVDVSLEPSASVLDEVVVTGTVIATERKEIATPITVITAEDIEKRGVTRIEELMRGEIPGLLARDRGIWTYYGYEGAMSSSSVYARGSAALNGTTNPIKTFVDGVEIFDPSYLGTIDASSIERIEIVTGPQAATIYGSGAMGGVMQIFTKAGNRAAQPELKLNLRYGLMQSNLSNGLTPMHNQLLEVRGGNGPGFSYSGNVSHRYSGQWQPDLFNRQLGLSLGATTTQGHFVITSSATFSQGKNGTYSGGSAYPSCGFGLAPDYCWPSLQNVKNIESGGLPPRVVELRSRRISEAESQTLSLNIDFQPLQFWQHHLTVGRNRNDQSMQPVDPTFTAPSDTMFLTSQSNGQRTSVSYNMTLLPRIEHVTVSMTIGVSGSWADHVTLSGRLVSEEASAITNPNASRPEVNSSWGGYGSWRLGILEQVFLSFGLRGESNPAYGRDHRLDLTPTAGIAHTLELGNLAVKWMASYGKATRPPLESYRREMLNTSPIWDPSPWVSQFASPGLTPEYSRGPQGGIEIYYGNVGSLTVNHYQQKVTSLIQGLLVDSIYSRLVSRDRYQWVGQYQYLNVASMKQYGWEGTGSLNIGRFSVKGTYSWSESRITAISNLVAPDQKYEVGEGFVYVPSHYGNITFGYAYGGTSFNLVSNWVGASIQSSYHDPMYYLRMNGRLNMYADQRIRPAPQRSVPGYIKSNLIASHRLSPVITATLNVQNVANSYTSDWGALFPTLGRKTLMGLSLQYPSR